MTNEQVKPEEEVQGIVDNAELTEEQLEIVAGGTCIPDPFRDKTKIPGLPAEN
jgi:hypothetical protein